MLPPGIEIDPTALPFCDDGHEPRPHPTRRRLRLHVLLRDRIAAQQATEVRTPPQLRPLADRLRVFRFPRPHLEPISVATPVHHRLDPRLLPLLLREPEGRHQRHVCSPTGRVRACHRPRPQPRDHREFLPHARPQVRSPPRHLLAHPHFRVQVPDPLLRLVPHPPPVVADVLGQALGSLPLAQMRAFTPLRVHRRTTRKLWRDLD